MASGKSAVPADVLMLHSFTGEQMWKLRVRSELALHPESAAWLPVFTRMESTMNDENKLKVLLKYSCAHMTHAVKHAELDTPVQLHIFSFMPEGRASLEQDLEANVAKVASDASETVIAMHSFTEEQAKLLGHGCHIGLAPSSHVNWTQIFLKASEDKNVDAIWATFLHWSDGRHLTQLVDYPKLDTPVTLHMFAFTAETRKLFAEQLGL